ncbi:MAG: hypothetical protein JSW03_02350, partial [Candidatus Eiseniibacteriota bacterium]
LEVPVRLADPFKNLGAAPTAATAQAVPHLLPTCLGLALRNVMACPLEVNLIPPRVVKAEKRKEQAVYWGLSFATLVLIAVAVVPIRAGQHRINEQRKDFLDAQIKEYQKHELKREDLIKKIDDYKEKYRLLNEMAGVNERTTWLVPLSRLCKAVPAGVTLGDIATIEFAGKSATGGRTQGGGGGLAALSGRLSGGGAAGLSGLSSGAFSGLSSRRDEGGGRRSMGTGARVSGSKPNGLSIVAYAETLRQIQEFKEALEGMAGVAEVVLYTEQINRVDRNSLRGTGGAAGVGGYGGFSGSSRSEERRGGLFGGGRGFAGLSGMTGSRGRMGGSGFRGTQYQNPQLVEENLIFQFRIDIKL